MPEFHTLDEYRRYVNELDIEQLKDIEKHINRERHGDRYRLVLEAIEEKKSENNESVAKHNGPIYAGFWKRTASILIDILVITPIILLQHWLDSFSKNVALITGISVPIILRLYDIYFNTRWGKTLGKMAVRIKIVKINYNSIGIREAMLRSSVDIIFTAIGMISMTIALLNISSSEYTSLTWKLRMHKLHELSPIWLRWEYIAINIWMWSEVIVLLFNKKKRAIHDFIAGTIVINEN